MLTTVGDMISYSTTIDETKHGTKLLFGISRIVMGLSKIFCHTVQNRFGHFTGPVQSVRGLNALKTSYRSYKIF